MGARSPLATYARLFRLSIAFTPIADVVTGFVATAETTGAFHLFNLRLAFACLASMSVFCFGTSLNDFLDRRKDSSLAPLRPIPSGSIAPRAALTASMFMAASALAFGLLAGFRSFAVIVLVLILAAAYNLFTRNWDWLGVINLGCIRAADLFVGFFLNDAASFTSFEWLRGGTGLPCILLVALYGGYGASLSTAALAERGQKKLDVRFPAYLALVLAFVPAASAFLKGHAVLAALLWVLLALPVLIPFTHIHIRVERLVGHLVSGFFLMGGLFVLDAGHTMGCLILTLLFLLSKNLGRLFPPS